MSLYLFDTDLLTLFCDGHRTVCERAAQHSLDELATSIVTIEEQLTGWYTLLRQAKSDRQLVTAYDGMTYSICGSSGILGECKNLTVLIRGLRFIPEGCQNSSMICGKHSLVSGIPPGCDPHSAPFRWSPLRCDHRLLSDIPSRM